MQAEQERGTEKLQLWRDQIAAFSFPRWNELPEIDLYMDQVVGYLSQKLSVFYDNNDDRRSITATMINNYVKQKIIAPPVKKRYGRAALSALMVLFCAKQVLSIGHSGLLIAESRGGSEQNDEAAAAFYDRFCRIFEEVLHRTVAEDTDSSYLAQLCGEDRVLAVTAAAFANQIYAERMLGQTETTADSESRTGQEEPT